MDSDVEPFKGFRLPNTTPVPDELFDELLPLLGLAELKVLLYIIRRTYGFKKDTDAISYSQFLHGITRKDGTPLDHGCGIKSATNLRKAIDSLVERGVILAQKDTTAAGDKATTVYTLHFAEGVLTQREYRHDSASGGVLTQRQTQETGNNKQRNKRRDTSYDDDAKYRSHEMITPGWLAESEPD